MSPATGEGFREFVEAVRERSDVVKVIGEDVALNETGSTLKGLSPFHHEKTPSFVVWPATQSWHDFSNGGGLGGDVFAYVQERHKIGFKEALYLLAQRAGIRPPDQDEDAWTRQLEALTERREVERLLTAAAAYYHRALPPELRETLYRQHYGFTDETVDRLHLGWADGRLLAHLTTVVGATRDAALKTGLFVLVRDGVKDLFQGRLVFPYWRGGQVVYFIARRTDQTPNVEWEKAKYRKLLTHSERHNYVSPTVRNDYFYNEDAARGAEELLITEGVTDCISAIQAGVPCISPVTTRFRTQDVPRLLDLTRHARRIVVCNDAEDNGAGEAGAKATAAAFWAAGREVCVATIPRPEGTDKIDVNELVATQGPDALREVMARALPYPEFLLANIPKDTPPAELDRHLQPVLAALVDCSPIRRDAVLGAITQRIGVGKRALNTSMKELRAQTQKPGPQAAPTAGQRPEIFVGARQLHDILQDARSVLIAANERRVAAAATSPFENVSAPIFVRGSSVVRLERPADGIASVVEVNEAAMHGLLAREADWVAETPRGKEAAFPPKDVSKDLLTYPPAGLPAIDTVLSTPVFSRGGHIIVRPGLHASDRLWLEADPSLAVPDVPEMPTPAQIDAARGLLVDDLFVDFPFVGQADRAHAVASLLQTFLRRLIDGPTPLYVVESPAAGTGKGLLCDLVAIVVTGANCAARTLPGEDDEVRKMLTAELRMSRPIILLDNANERRQVASSSLASALTTTDWTDRLLKSSEMLTLPNRGLWMLTGNNPALAVDISRRSVPIRIDAGRDRPWIGRGYKHDPIRVWARAHRSELVHAALVLIQAWVAQGQPQSSARLGSFEHWASIMGGVLETCGVDGFLGNLEDLYANADVESDAWRRFTATWWESHGPTPTATSELHALCEAHDLLPNVRGDGAQRSQQTRLGNALHKVRDRVYGEFQIVTMPPDRNKRSLYALRQVTGHAAP